MCIYIICTQRNIAQYIYICIYIQHSIAQDKTVLYIIIPFCSVLCYAILVYSNLFHYICIYTHIIVYSPAVISQTSVSKLGIVGNGLHFALVSSTTTPCMVAGTCWNSSRTKSMYLYGVQGLDKLDLQYRGSPCSDFLSASQAQRYIRVSSSDATVILQCAACGLKFRRQGTGISSHSRWTTRSNNISPKPNAKQHFY